MDRRTFLGAGATALAAITLSGRPATAADNDGKTMSLPKPDTAGGKPLMECLAKRRSAHTPGSSEPDIRMLGDILWAAWGVNREDGKHVIPTGMNRQEVAVFAVRSDGVWEYLPKEHAIKRVIAGDLRGRFDGSGCILLYAAPEKERFAAMHVGSIYQNVGLYCASAGLKNCVKWQKHDALDAELPLKAGWATLISQSISR